MFRKLCGESTLKNVVLVTNMWNVNPHHINEAWEDSDPPVPKSIIVGRDRCTPCSIAASCDESIKRAMHALWDISLYQSVAWASSKETYIAGRNWICS